MKLFGKEPSGVGSENAQDGFTLIELMVTVAVLVILVTFAAPAFQDLVESRRITTKTNLLLSSVNTTRSEAIKSGGVVTIKAVNGDFANGWCIYPGASGDACKDATPIRSYEGSDALKIDANGATQIEFNARGSLDQPEKAVSLEISPSEGQTQASHLCISLSGRASTKDSEC